MMQFGLFGGARTSRMGPQADSTGYGDFIAYVKQAERLGFGHVFLVEHHFTGYGQLSATLTLLSYLAACTTRIRLGTAVTVLPWHNPVLLAEQVATLDLLSNGRFDFGIGRGYREQEFSGFCIPMNEAADRFDEAIEVIRKAWTSEGRFSHHGKRWHFDNIVVEPAPMQQPHPPFWLGAGSKTSICRAAREGYNLLLDQIAPVDVTVERVAIFREECRHIGRPYQPMMVGVTRALQLAYTNEEREQALRTRARVLKTIGGLASSSEPTHRLASLVDPILALESDDAPLLGTPAQIVARLKELEAGGIELVLLVDPSSSVAALQTFGAEIMPAFTNARIGLGLTPLP
jgi:alkanesulfonate monooxygenase SsuD/methylene tetrahydromethanopterin reductase-like flavin-dependent oxidoreductase (luciferase family)